MKKIIALLLAVIMVMGLATVVSADVDTTGWTSDGGVVELELKKIYTVTGQSYDTENTIVPHETLSFKVEAGATNPTEQMLSVASVTAPEMDNGTASRSATLAITLPEYTATGIYDYTITEIPGVAQGATYADEVIKLQVMVAYDYANNKLSQVVSLTAEGDGKDVQVGEKWKLDTFRNEYALGELDVTKTVTGNMGAKDVEFKMTVTFTSANKVMSNVTIIDETSEDSDDNLQWKTVEKDGKTVHQAVATIYVKDGETVKFHNIPEGITYEVAEDAQHAVADPNYDDPTSGYAVSYDSNKTGTIDDETVAKTTVTNNKDIKVETGIAMDSVPFIVMAVVAVLGLAAFTAKKRVQE